eukprot:g1164.t1
MWALDGKQFEQKPDLVISKPGASNAADAAGDVDGGGDDDEDGNDDNGGVDGDGGGASSYSIDDIDFGGSADESTRRKAVKKIASALASTKKKSRSSSSSSSSKALRIAEAVELTLYETHGAANKGYRARVRALGASLKNELNGELRREVVDGTISPAELAVMSAAELAKGSLKEQRQEFVDKHNRQTTTGGEDWTESPAGSHRCARCGKDDKIRYRIEGGSTQTNHKTETWGTADTAQMKVHFMCANCAHRWEQDTL